MRGTPSPGPVSRRWELFRPSRYPGLWCRLSAHPSRLRTSAGVPPASPVRQFNANMLFAYGITRGLIRNPQSKPGHNFLNGCPADPLK